MSCLVHDYVRHGTTTLFAALDVATGTSAGAGQAPPSSSGSLVSTSPGGQCPARPRRPPHRGQLRHPQTSQGAYLAGATASLSCALHPTYSSWLNQVERWFGLITQRAIRRGSFTSVQDLAQKINAFVQHYNRSCRPVVWTARARFAAGEVFWSFQSALNKCLVYDHLGGDVRQFTSRPRFHLLSHRLEVSLHPVNADRDGVNERGRL